MVGTVYLGFKYLSHFQLRLWDANLTIDLFPRTDENSGTVSLNRQPPKNHFRPIPENGKTEKYIPDINLMLSFHVECVVLMQRCGQKFWFYT